jgi:hypothetical protein
MQSVTGDKMKCLVEQINVGMEGKAGQKIKESVLSAMILPDIDGYVSEGSGFVSEGARPRQCTTPGNMREKPRSE